MHSSIYTLNLVFKMYEEEQKNDGRFGPDDEPMGLLGRNLRWLVTDVKGGPPEDLPTPSFDPKSEDLDQVGPFTIPQNPHRDWICVRAVQHSASKLPAGAKVQKVRLAVSFGKPPRARQEHASPFTHDDTENGRAVTTFLGESNAPGPEWFFPLKKIAKRPKTDKRLSHRYEFSVGLIVTTTDGKEFHYGEDPEMDIGL